MFIGHYSVALALKKGEPTASLGFLFLAVQLADILFFPLVLLGIERPVLSQTLLKRRTFDWTLPHSPIACWERWLREP
jgi:hypothetical protein